MAYAAWTEMRRGCSCGRFGMLTSSTPFTCLALIASASALSGRLKRRRNEPVARSTRSKAIGRCLALRVTLAADRQHTLVGRDFDVLAFDARQIGGHYEALGFLADVHVRDPADARGTRAVSTLAHGALELPLEAAQQRPRLVTNDGHKALLLECW